MSLHFVLNTSSLFRLNRQLENTNTSIKPNHQNRVTATKNETVRERERELSDVYTMIHVRHTCVPYMYHSVNTVLSEQTYKLNAVRTRLPFNLRQNHPRMRAFSYACSFLVTWQRWRLHHSIRRIRKPHAARKHQALCLTERDLLPIEVLHCGVRIFCTFLTPVTLTLARWPSYTNSTRSPWKYTACAKCKYELHTSRLSKVIVWQADRHTYTHTDTAKII